YLFLSNDPMSQKNLQTLIDSCHRSYHRQISKSAQRLGIQGFQTHDLRRNYANQILNQGGRIEVVSKLLRHKHISTTLIYLPPIPKDTFIILDKAQKKMLRKE